MKNNIRYDERYNTLLAVYRLGSYTAAGNLLSLTPSAVSQQIHSVETELGAVMFNRGGKKLVPTKECEIVAESAASINAICDRMVRDLDNVRHSLKNITVGVTPSFESGALAGLLTSYCRGVDYAQITVITETSDLLLGKLSSHAIDVAVVEGEAPDGMFNSILLDTDYLTVAVPPDHPSVKTGYITVGQLMKEKLILRPEGSGTRALFEANLKKNGMTLDEFNVMMEIDNVETIKKLVSAGYGVSIMSVRACRKDVGRGSIAAVALRDMNMARNIHIYYRKDFHYEELFLKIQNLYAESLADNEKEDYLTDEHVTRKRTV